MIDANFPNHCWNLLFCSQEPQDTVHIKVSVVMGTKLNGHSILPRGLPVNIDLCTCVNKHVLVFADHILV